MMLYIFEERRSNYLDDGKAGFDEGEGRDGIQIHSTLSENVQLHEDLSRGLHVHFCELSFWQTNQSFLIRMAR